MANEFRYAIRVNQKLAFARILIKSAENFRNDQSVPTQQSIHALLDGAILQLHDALSYLLVEIAVQTQPSIDVDYYSIKIILRQLQEQGVDNPLTREFDQLIKQDTWLRTLISAKYDAEWLFGSGNQSSDFDFNKNENNIPYVNLDHPSSNLPSHLLLNPSINLVGQWLANTQAIIERHRSLTVEN